ncbi:hypothetical protein CDAR_296121 [Caerostris darwini]|uniref:Uncharacterized protein n=1 Tax=Caerostris darwini TaxID=1538125 RepID=A0AAV4USF4_9ARAC|nr:hypothetical protein CDAR_296121 [Caerostris darwini]
MISVTVRRCFHASKESKPKWGNKDPGQNPIDMEFILFHLAALCDLTFYNLPHLACLMQSHLSVFELLMCLVLMLLESIYNGSSESKRGVFRANNVPG